MAALAWVRAACFGSVPTTHASIDLDGDERRSGFRQWRKNVRFILGLCHPWVLPRTVGSRCLVLPKSAGLPASGRHMGLRFAEANPWGLACVVSGFPSSILEHQAFRRGMQFAMGGR